MKKTYFAVIIETWKDETIYDVYETEREAEKVAEREDRYCNPQEDEVAYVRKIEMTEEEYYEEYKKYEIRAWQKPSPIV